MSTWYPEPGCPGEKKDKWDFPIPYSPQGTFLVLKVYPCRANHAFHSNGALTKLGLFLWAKEAMVLEGGYYESIEMCDCLLNTRADLRKELLNQFLLFVNMITSSKGSIFSVTGLLCGEFTGHRWIPRTKASDAELWCFLWSAPE